MSNQDESSTGVRNAGHIHLAQQRKRAKELLKGFRAGDHEAKRRVAAQRSQPTSILKLAQAQWVVAREAGFRGWPELKLCATQTKLTRAELIESVLSAALSGHQPAVDTALELTPELPSESIHVAAALADEAALSAHLRASSENTSLATRPGGTQQFSPLAYLCHARIGREQLSTQTARARLAKQLIAAGADPKECVDTEAAPGGKFSVLSAAARHTASSELVAVLLDAGAELEPPGSTAGPPAPPLVAAAMGGNLECVKQLLAAKAPGWQAREALEIAVEASDSAMARALLDYGASPDHAGRWAGRNGGCLHAALLLGRDVSFVELLIAGGASVKARDRDQRSPLQVAVQVNAPEAAALLRQHGASDDEVDDRDRLVGACVAGDTRRVHALLATDLSIIQRCRIADHQMVCWAARHGRTSALIQLLRAGFNANTVDDDGETALHLAMRRADLEAVAELVAHGASAATRNYENVTPLDYALTENDTEVRRALLVCLSHSDAADEVRQLLGDDEEIHLASGADVEDFPEVLQESQQRLAAAFEAALATMVAGDLEGLRALLDREPALATARSARYHRATLLHYLSSNGTELVVVPKNAGAMAQLLLDRGAAVDASCKMYGGGPYQTTLGLVVTSSYPEQEGLTDDLVGALVRAGARLNEADGRSSALEGAILYTNVRAVRALAKHGVRADDLPLAAAIGDLAHVEGELAKSDAPPAEVLASALQNAAAFGHLPIVERLVAQGVDINAPSGESGTTPLHKAAIANHVSVVQWLLDHGADPTLQDKEYHGTPAGWAEHFGAHEASALLRKQE